MTVESEKLVDFGYKQVPEADKEKHVADVFTSVAKRYDIMNDLMSFGLHRIWKHIAIELCGVRKGHRVLDIAGGTGDLTKQFCKLVGKNQNVTLTDINADMLSVGRDRLIDKNITNVDYVQANAECLPFPDNYFDCATIAFGLRNVTHKDKALESILRVLRPGGRLMVLEFSKPMKAIKPFYDAYSFSVLPKLGKMIANDPNSYRYLAESIRKHPDQTTLKTMMETAGFENCEYFNLTAGIVAIHRGFKF